MINCDVMHVDRGVTVNILHTPGSKVSVGFPMTSLVTMVVQLVNVVSRTSILTIRRILKDHRCVVYRSRSHAEPMRHESTHHVSDNNRSHMKETMNN